MVNLHNFPHKLIKVKKIKWEKKGKYIRYKVPKYRVEFIDSKEARKWLKEYELEAAAAATIITDNKNSESLKINNFDKNNEK